MGHLNQGEVILSKEIECHKGKLAALEGQQLVSVFLGTCQEGQIPAVVQFMNQLGWFRADLYEVVTDILTVPYNEIFTKNTLFVADSRGEACEAAVRFARRQAMFQADSAIVTAIEVHVARLGEIGMDGVPQHARSEKVMAWNDKDARTLDEVVVEKVGAEA